MKNNLNHQVQEVRRLLDEHISRTNDVCCAIFNFDRCRSDNNFTTIFEDWRPGNQGLTKREIENEIRSKALQIAENLSSLEDTLSNQSSIVDNKIAELGELKSKISIKRNKLSLINKENEENKLKISTLTNERKLKQDELRNLQIMKKDLFDGLSPKQVGFLVQKSVEIEDRELFDITTNLNFEINFQNRAGESLLHTSVIYRSSELFKKLCAHSHELAVNSVDRNLSSALLLAAKTQQFDVCFKLVEMGSDIYLKDTSGLSPYHILRDKVFSAIASEDLSFLRIVKALPMDLTKFRSEDLDQNILYTSIANAKQTVSELFFERGFIEIAALEAVTLRDISTLQTLINMGADINQLYVDGRPILYKALKLGFTEALNLISSKDALYDCAVNSIADSDLSVLEQLRYLTPDLHKTQNKKGELALVVAMRNSSSEVVDFLKNMGATLYDAINSVNNSENVTIFKASLLNFETSLLSRHVAYSNNLKILKLDNCNLSAANISSIALGISNSNSLQEVFLDNNNIGNTQIREFHDAFIKDKLKIISIKKIGIDFRGLSFLSKSLTSAEELKSLSLSQNNIGDARGSIFLKKILESCSSLKILDISDIQLDDTGSVKILEALMANTNIIYCNISNNNKLSQNGYLNFLTKLENSKSLVGLALGEIDVFKNDLNQITNSLTNLLEASQPLLDFGDHYNQISNISNTISSKKIAIKSFIQNFIQESSFDTIISYFGKLTSFVHQIHYKLLVMNEEYSKYKPLVDLFIDKINKIDYHNNETEVLIGSLTELSQYDVS